MKRRWGVGSGTKGNVVIGKEEVREAFRALMKEEGAGKYMTCCVLVLLCGGEGGEGG